MSAGLVLLSIGYLGPSTCDYADGTGGLGTIIVGVVLLIVALFENGRIR